MKFRKRNPHSVFKDEAMNKHYFSCVIYVYVHMCVTIAAPRRRPSCPPDKQLTFCFVDPCAESVCARANSACKPNKCGGCFAEWYNAKGERLRDADCSPPTKETVKPTPTTSKPTATTSKPTTNTTTKPTTTSKPTNTTSKPTPSTLVKPTTMAKPTTPTSNSTTTTSKPPATTSKPTFTTTEPTTTTTEPQFRRQKQQLLRQSQKLLRQNQ